jgi:hypothetical protein
MPNDTELNLSLSDMALDLDIKLSLDDPAPGYDPLADVEYGAGMEVDSKAELRALKEAFQNPSGHKRNFATINRERQLRNDSEYWVAVCFQSRSQKEEFLRNAGVPADEGDKYLDGVMLAKKLSIPLTKEVFPPQKQGNIDHVWAGMARKG